MGMESLTGNPLHIRIVQEIADEGIAQKSQVNPDLMGTPGRQANPEEGKSLSVIQPFIMGDGTLPMFKIHAAHEDRICPSANGSADGAGRRRFSFDDGKVLPV